jgi:hypothetical protein
VAGLAWAAPASRYTMCIDGRQETGNRKIEELLREYE